MPTPILCPDAQALKEYLLGQTPEQAARDVEEHVAVCSACALKLNELTDRDTLAQPLPRQAVPVHEVGGEVEALIGRLCRRADVVGLAAAAPVGDVLGDFRIVREIGRGGMGVVYVAEQISLGRKVALKVLPFAAALDQKQLQRFKNEAQAAAQLHHTNIVPVHYVGCERGVHFYAMQFIEGQSLAGVLDELREGSRRRENEKKTTLSQVAQDMGSGHLLPDQAPTPESRVALADLPEGNAETLKAAAVQSASPERLSSQQSFPSPAYFRTVARLGVQAAEALEHAHQLGVIHRDIKPANLLVDAHTNLWITDFGLAHCQSNAGLTMTGDLLGTLRYMSPEQGLANRVVIDHRTDIYSLGASLYEMLTLQPAFAGSDRQELLRQIAFEEPRPLRRVNKSVPAELETIVLKAMEKNPAERYTTAQEMAADLERHLKDEPIRARRATLLQKVRKWARRHPAVVRAAGVVLVLAVVGLAVSNARIRQERDQRDQALREKDTALTVAEANFRKARAAVERSFTIVSESDLFDVTGLHPLRKQLLENALQYHREFVDQKPDDPKLQAELAASYFRISRIYRTIDLVPASIAALRQALEIVDKLRREHGGDVEVLRILTTVRYGAGSFHAFYVVGSFTEHLSTLRGAAEIWEALATENPSIPQFQRNLAEVYDEIANLLRYEPARDAQEALRMAEKAFEIWEGLSREHPALEGLAEMPYRRGWLGVVLAMNGRLHEAEKVLKEAIDFAQVQVAQNPKARRHRERLASFQRRVAEVFSDSSRPEQAEQPWRRAISFYESLVGDYPGVPSFAWYLGDCYVQLGQVLRTIGRPREAEQSCGKALLRFEKLTSEYPESAGYFENVCGCHLQLCSLCLENSRREEAENHYRAALGLARDVVTRFPSEAVDMAYAYGEFASFLNRTGQIQEEEKVRRETVSIFEKLATDFPTESRNTEQVGESLRQLALFLALHGKAVEAVSVAGKAISIDAKLSLAQPAAPARRGRLADSQRIMSIALANAKRPAEAERAYQQAAGIHEQLAVDFPKEPSHRRDLAMTYRELALVLSRDPKRLKETETNHRQALALFEKLAAEFPNDLQYAEQAGGSRRYLANLLISAGRPQEAEAIAGKAISTFEKLALAQPNVPGYRQILGDTHRIMAFALTNKRPAEAEKAYRQAVAIDEKLLAELPKERSHRRDLAQDYFALAYLLWSTGQSQEAEKAYARFFELAPKNPVAHNNLAWLLATCPDVKFRIPKRAVELAQRAVEQAPKEGMYWNTLGVAHYRTGEWNAAIGALDKAMELRKGGDSFDWFFLAMVHWQLGDKKEAAKWHHQAVQWMEKNAPQNEELRRFRAEADALMGASSSETQKGSLGPKSQQRKG